MSIVIEEPRVIIAALDTGLRGIDLQEEKLLDLIESLQIQRTEMSILTKLMHALAMGKSSKSDVHITDDEIKKCIVCVHRYDPHIFDNLVTGVPDGILTQPMQPVDHSVSGWIEAGMAGVTLADVEIAPLPPKTVDLLLRRLGHELDGRGTTVSGLTSEIQMTYGDQGQIVEIMRDINDQNKRLIEFMNNLMRG